MTQIRGNDYTRKYKVIINGVEERAQEDPRAEVVKIITEKLQVDLDKVHRFGRSINGQPRPIIAKCFSLLVRDRIFQNVKKLANTGITMREDRHQELDTLPRELSLAAAKTVSTQNTICFQGKHNPLSNFYESQIVNADGHVCNNAEQLFQARKALHLGRDDVAKKNPSTK